MSDFVVAALELQEVSAFDLIGLGAVYCNDVRCEKNIVVAAGDYVRVHSRPRRYDVKKIEISDVLVFKNSDFIVINKPAAIPVHATVDNSKENLICRLSALLEMQLRVTHRLDNATQGLMVLALTEDFQKIFNGLLRAGKVDKEYRAIVHGVEISKKFVTNQWVHFMQPSPRAPKILSRNEIEGWQKCILTILSERQCGENQTELNIKLETGRTHQIRAQLSAEGHAVVGDLMYGSTFDFGAEKIELYSQKLSFGEFSFSLG